MTKKNYDFEPVHIRSKKISGGRQSLYLDIVNDGVRSREFLKLYLLPEDGKGAKSANNAVMRMAEEIKAKRTLEVLRDGLQIEDHTKGNMVLVDRLKEQQAYYKEHNNRNYSRTIGNLIVHLGKHAKKGLRLKDVTPKFLRGFLKYLRGDNVNKYGGRLCPETSYTYFTVFSILMNKAVRLEMIPANPFYKLSQAENTMNKRRATRDIGAYVD